VLGSGRSRRSRAALINFDWSGLTTAPGSWPRPAFSQLPDSLRRDIKAFFGSYAEACRIGDSLLFSAGQKAAVDAECKKASVGKLTADALYVHVSAVNLLSPLLRVYEGCARTLMGAVEGATLVKLRRDKAKVSYLVYPAFDDEGHPPLAETYVADLRRLRIDHRDYRTSPNPPLLHRKETFVASDYPAWWVIRSDASTSTTHVASRAIRIWRCCARALWAVSQLASKPRPRRASAELWGMRSLWRHRSGPSASVPRS